jgi:hypothetical protein
LIGSLIDGLDSNIATSDFCAGLGRAENEERRIGEGSKCKKRE